MTAPADPPQGDTALPPHARALAEAHAEDGYLHCPLTDGSDSYTALVPLLTGLVPATPATTRDRAA